MAHAEALESAPLNRFAGMLGWWKVEVVGFAETEVTEGLNNVVPGLALCSSSSP